MRWALEGMKQANFCHWHKEKRESLAERVLVEGALLSSVRHWDGARRNNLLTDPRKKESKTHLFSWLCASYIVST